MIYKSIYIYIFKVDKYCVIEKKKKHISYLRALICRMFAAEFYVHTAAAVVD